MNPTRRHRWPIAGLLLLYFVAAVWMAFRLPAHATPNELLNFEYVQVMRQIRGLPNRGLVDSEVRYTEWHQPPLYFTWAALVGLSIPVEPSAVNPPPPIEVTANPHFLSTPRGNLNPVVHVTPRTTPLLYTSRLAAALLGMVGVATLYRAGRRVYGPWVALLMASFLAFQPGYLHLSGSVNNDMPLTAMVAVVMSFAILLLQRQLRRTNDELRIRQDTKYEIRDTRVAGTSTPPTRHSSRVSRISYLILGLLTALTILTKANGVFVLVFPAVVLLGLLVGGKNELTTDGHGLNGLDGSHRISDGSIRFHRSSIRSQFFNRQHGRLWRTLSAALAIALGLLPLWAGWLWLNTVRLRDTLGLSGSLPVGRVLALGPLDFGHVIPFLPAVWRSYWLDWSAGDVGYGPDWLYAFWLAAVVGMLLGWLKRPPQGGVTSEGGSKLFTRHLVGRQESSLVTLLVLLGFLGISYLYFAVKALTVKEAGWMVPEARWWLPGLPALAWLAAAGFARWWSPRRRALACAVAAAVPPLIAFGLLLFHLPALYPRAERLDVTEGSTGVIYDGALELIATEVGALTTGRAGTVTLTWRAGEDIDTDYSIATQLLTPAAGGWRKLAEHNSFPGQGMEPTAGWRAGDVYRDRLTLIPAGDLNGPTAAVVQVTARVGNQDAPTMADGQTLVEPPIVASAVVRPVAPLVAPKPLAEPVAFGEAIQLTSVTIEETAGGRTLVLWWAAGGAPATNYTVFVHLVDVTGAVVAQIDGPPNDGLSPTAIWQAGDVIRDVRQLPAGAATQSLIGLYDPATGARLPAIQAGQSLLNNAYTITLNP